MKSRVLTTCWHKANRCWLALLCLFMAGITVSNNVQAQDPVDVTIEIVGFYHNIACDAAGDADVYWDFGSGGIAVEFPPGAANAQPILEAVDNFTADCATFQAIEAGSLDNVVDLPGLMAHENDCPFGLAGIPGGTDPVCDDFATNPACIATLDDNCIAGVIGSVDWLAASGGAVPGVYTVDVGYFADGGDALEAVICPDNGGAANTYVAQVQITVLPVAGALACPCVAPVDVVWDGTYGCLFATDDEDQTAQVTVTVSGGDGTDLIVDSSVGATDFIPAGPYADGSNVTFTVTENQPWSVTFSNGDTNGDGIGDGACSGSVDGVLQQPEPEILVSSNAVCLEDPDFLIWDASFFEAFGGGPLGIWPIVGGGGPFDNGNYSATFSPFLAGPGVHLVTYQLPGLDIGGLGPHACTVSEDALISVFPTFNATFDAGGNPLPTAICSGDAAFPLTFVDPTIANTFAAVEPEFDPDGVVDEMVFYIQWSGPGVTDNDDAGGTGTFDPAAAGPGVHTILAEIGYPSCEQVMVHTITVYDVADATINNLTVCSTPSGSFNLTQLFTPATTYGGTFTGTVTSGGPAAVSGNVLTYLESDPTTVYPIVVDITYTVGNDDGSSPDDCFDTDGATVTILEAPDANFDLPDLACASSFNNVPNAAVVVLNNYLVGALPNTGVFTGTNVSLNGGNYEFDPNGLASGLYTITYTETVTVDGGVCQYIQEEVIEVYDPSEPNPTFCMSPDNTGNNLEVCEQDAPILLTPHVTPAGGTFTGTGVMGNVFNPAGLAPGDYTVTYCVSSIVNGDVCEDCVEGTITVKESVDATWNAGTAMCPQNLGPIVCEGGGTESDEANNIVGGYDLDALVCGDPVVVTEEFQACITGADADVLTTLQVEIPGIADQSQIIDFQVAIAYYDANDGTFQGDIDVLEIRDHDGNVVMHFEDNEGPNGAGNDSFGTEAAPSDIEDCAFFDAGTGMGNGTGLGGHCANLDAYMGMTAGALGLSNCLPDPVGCTWDVPTWEYDMLSTANDFDICMTISITYTTGEFMATTHEDGNFGQLPLPYDGNNDGDYDDPTDIAGGVYEVTPGVWVFDATDLEEYNEVEITFMRYACASEMDLSNAADTDCDGCVDHLCHGWNTQFFFVQESFDASLTEGTVCETECQYDLTQLQAGTPAPGFEINGGDFWAVAPYTDLVNGDILEACSVIAAAEAVTVADATAACADAAAAAAAELAAYAQYQVDSTAAAGMPGDAVLAQASVDAFNAWKAAELAADQAQANCDNLTALATAAANQASFDVAVWYSKGTNPTCGGGVGMTTVTVFRNYDAGFSFVQTACTGGTYTLTANSPNAGGVWSGSLLAQLTDNGDGTWTVSADADGLYTLTQTITNGDCTSSWSQDTYVASQSTVTANDGAVCNGGGLVNLTQFVHSSTPGGSFSGDNVAGNTFDPSGYAAGAVVTITYSVGPDGSTCQASDSFDLTIGATADADFDLPEEVCVDEAINLGAWITGTPGGLFTLANGDPVPNPNAWTPDAGTYTVTYTVGDGACADSHDEIIIVNSAATAVAVNPNYVCQSEDDYSIDLTQYLPSGSQVINGGTFSLAAMKPIITEIQYDSNCDEFVEVMWAAGQDLAGWSLCFYDRTEFDANDATVGSASGRVYLRWDLGGIVPIQQGASNGQSYGTVNFPINPTACGDDIHSGPAAIALVRPDGAVMQFIGYGPDDEHTNWGIFAACDGPAAGLISTDINTVDGDGSCGSLQFENDCWAAYTCPNNNGGAINPGLAPNASNEFFYDYIAPDGDILHLDRFCWSLFVGGRMYADPAGPVDLSKNQTLDVNFNYELLNPICGSNVANFRLTVLMDNEEWWTAPNSVCEDGGLVNLNDLIDESVHFIEPEVSNDGTYSQTTTCTYEEDIEPPFMSELNLDNFELDIPAADGHCIAYNFFNTNGTPSNPADDFVDSWDICEGVEVSGAVGQDLSCYSLVFYGYNAAIDAVPNSPYNAIPIDVTYITPDGLLETTDVINGEYMPLYGTITNDQEPQVGPLVLAPVPNQIGADDFGNIPTYGNSNPFTLDPGTAPAVPGVYVDANNNGFYDVGETQVDATTFPWDQADQCAANSNDGVGSHWFPVLDIPNTGAGVGFYNHCTGEMHEFISWGDKLQVVPAANFTQAGLFERQCSEVIDTVQNATLGGLRSIQLFSCDEFTGPEAATLQTFEQCQEDGLIWGIVFLGNQVHFYDSGSNNDVVLTTANGINPTTLSNTIGYYNCNLNPDEALPTPGQQCVLDLSGADFPDNYVITEHTTTVTISPIGLNAPFQVYTYEIGTAGCGGTHNTPAGEQLFYESLDTEVPGTCNPNACISGEAALSNPNWNPLLNQLGYTFDDPATNTPPCFVGHCTSTAKTQYFVRDIHGYIYGDNNLVAGDDIACSDSSLVLVITPDQFEVTITVDLDYEQCFPIGHFTGHGGYAGSTSVNWDDLDSPYWEWDPTDLSDFSPAEITYVVNNTNAIQAGSATDNLDCLDDDNDNVRTQLIPVVSQNIADLTVDALDFCIGDDATDLAQYFGPSTGGDGHFSGSAGISGHWFDPNNAGVGTHVVTYTVDGSGLCVGSDAITITIGDDLSSDWTLNADVVTAGIASLCTNEAPYELSNDGIATITGAALTADLSANGTASQPLGSTVTNGTATATIPAIPCDGEIIVVDVAWSYDAGEFGDASFFEVVAPDGTIIATGTNDNASGDTTFVDFSWTNHAGVVHNGTQDGNGDGTWTFNVISNSFPWEIELDVQLSYVQGAFSGAGVEYLGDGEYIYNPAGLEDFNPNSIFYSAGCGACNTGPVEQTVYIIDGSNLEIVMGTNPTEVCSGDAPSLLDATPLGGVWTGSGVTGDGNGFYFDPSNLEGDITLTYTVGGGDDIVCNDSESITVNVAASPSADFWPESSACAADGVIDLNATLDPDATEGGTWTLEVEGTGSDNPGGSVEIENGIFDPAGHDGVAVIAYTVSDAGCFATEYRNITIHGEFDAEWSVEEFSVCENDLPLAITINQDGGWWDSAEGTVTQDTSGVYWFDVELLDGADHGAYDLTYNGGSVNCPSQDTHVINVYAIPATPEASITDIELCGDDSAPVVDITGFPDYCNCPVSFAVYSCDGEWLADIDAINEFTFNPNEYMGDDCDTTYCYNIVAVNKVCESDPVTVTVDVRCGPEFDYTTGCTDVVTLEAAIRIETVSTPGPYEVSVNGGEFFDFIPGETLNVLVLGANDVVVRDGNGCESAVEVVVVPDPVTFDGAVSCPDTDGFATLTVSAAGGEAGDYELSVDGGVTYGDPGVLSAQIDASAVSSVSVRVRDSKGCESGTQVFEIDGPVSFLTEQSCPVDGLVTITVIAPDDNDYIVSVNGAAQDCGDYDFETPEGSTVVITLASCGGSGCESAPVAVDAATSFSITTTQECPQYDMGDTDVDGDETSSTVVDIDVEGAGSVTTITVDGEDVGTVNSYTFVNEPGTHTICAVDAAGCEACTDVEIFENTVLSFNKEESIHLACGEPIVLIVELTGADEGTTYEWSLNDPDFGDPVVTSEAAFTTSDILGSLAIIYVQGVTADGCTSQILPINISSFEALVVDASDPICSADGSTYTIEMTISGGEYINGYDIQSGVVGGELLSSELTEGELGVFGPYPAGSSYTILIDDACPGFVSGTGTCATPCAADAGTLTGLSDNTYCFSSDIVVQSTGFNAFGGHTQTYIITDAALNIVAMQQSGFFASGLPAGNYTVWALNFLPSDFTNPGVGGNAGDLAGCFDLSGGFDITILSEIIIDAQVVCSDALMGYVVQISVTGGTPEANGAGAYGLSWPVLENGGAPSVIWDPALGAAVGTIVDGMDAAGNPITFGSLQPISIDVDSDGALCEGGPVVVVTPDAPCGLVAEDDMGTTTVNTPITFNLLGNDTPSTAENEIRVTNVQESTDGVTVWTGDGTFTFIPNPGFTGLVTLVYVITDANGMTATATIMITVMGEESSVLDVMHNLDCTNTEVTGMYTVTFIVTGGVGNITATGDFSGMLVNDEAVSFTAADGSPYSVTITDDESSITITGGELPCTKVAVELLDFSGEVRTGNNFVKWMTATETDNARFILEHSVNGQDFETIATVEGAGNSATANAYDFTHRNAPAGLSYYQLTTVDFDGVHEVIETITLNRGNVDFGFVSVYPVPATTMLNVEFTAIANASVDMQVFDLTGRLMATQTVDVNQGFNKTQIDVAAYPAGAYFITMTNGSEVITTKFIKE